VTGVDKNEQCIQCPICDLEMHRHITSWAWRCARCGVQAANHAATVDPIGWDSTSNQALTELRTTNAHRILELLQSHTTLPGSRLLDVGCAAGWFLNVANTYGLNTLGIEPDVSMATAANAAGNKVRNDWFPQAIQADEQFKIVTFNDVYEHLPNPNQALKDVASCLYEGGYLLLNLPSADGFLYRTASMLARIGYCGPYERLWQCNYESPHLFYFNPDNLRTLVEAHGFHQVGQTRIDAISIRGLWARINETGNLSPIIAAFIWTAVVVLSPVTRFVLPNDIMVHLYQRQVPLLNE